MALQIISCIYKIENTVNGKCYIGSAVDFLGRRRAHRSVLGKNKHHSEKLQRAWNKYGSDVFVFAIVEAVPDRENLIAREQYWIDSVKPDYNILKFAGSPLGNKHSEETRAKMSAQRLGVKKPPRTEEGRRNIAAAATGRIMSAETKAKISAALTGRLKTPEERANISAAQKCRVTTDKVRASQSASRRGKKQSPEAIARRIAGIRAFHALKKQNLVREVSTL